MDAAKKIAETVLYEGYVLWPYRRSAMKNQQRWTFGGVYPRAYSEARGEDDPWLMQTQCLVSGDEASTIEVKVRFLHVTGRKVGKRAGGTLEFVDELRVGEELYLPWDEATEREIAVGRFEVSGLLGSSRRVNVDIPAGSTEEPLAASTGEIVGAVVRGWRTLRGTVGVEAERLREGAFRVTVRITNTTPWAGEDRESTLRQTFVSTHTTLEVEGGEFVSLIDPPEEFREVAESCENLKTWPVLVGEEGDRSMVLSSPIILYDYPQVAPESPGDLFDGGEIDQMLILNILTLTDEEKEEMRASDPRAGEILARCESLSQEELMNLHGGAVREFRMLRE
ncbi:MAG: Uncharacterized protein MSMEG_2715 [uncultured Rubrobacteraceae bacterium]|uniref:Uncharacterized protein MSMEG_2715 n=1 Tax=uncultured Rubrobacteraceae bacterium TaxID=349277 RepID=A0A6J4P7T9_9ACTN|nr:MAG: Uncharacterized protein MSMEG_2715 [uncultured Rubrobacteraceae bacterium]